ncbi:MAG: response regulator [Clostridiales Family XIII bacterium]|nr:response regulator [Clostridiales Family XIII bacterium]
MNPALPTLSVLIVDDENWICQLIKESVPWEELNMNVAALAGNGVEALRVLRDSHIDIVITDIRMPGVDGLELIRSARAEGIDSHFIIVSGYRDFEYARQAMSCNVVNYVLKPVDEDELALALSRIRDSIYEKNSKDQYDSDVMSKLKNTTGVLRKQILCTIAKEGDANIRPTEIEGIEGWDPSGMAFTCAIFCVDDDTSATPIAAALPDTAATPGASATPDNETRQIVVENLLLNVEKQIRHAEFDFESFIDENAITCILMHPRDFSIREFIKNCFNELKIHIEAYDGFVVTAGVGGTVESLTQIHQSWIDADTAVKYRVVAGTNTIIESNKLAFANHSTGKLSAAQQAQLTVLCEARDIAAIESYIDGLLEPEYVKELNPNTLHQILNDALATLTEVVGSEGTDADVFADRIVRIGSLSALKAFVKDFIKAIFAGRDASRASGQQQMIAAAKEYIMENYKADITLTDVAEFVHLNPNYISTLFKKETGSTFMNYLQEYRMEKARALLRDTTMRVFEIALEVGYQDERHFAKLFKKIIGLTPNEYRKLNA